MRKRKGGGDQVDAGARRGKGNATGAIRVVAGEAWASVPRGWEGSVRVALIAANFGRKDRILDDVRLRHVRVGPIRVADPRVHVDSRGLVLPARGVARAFLDLRLGGDEVARLLSGFEPAPNPESSPKVDMECAGELVVRGRLRSREEPFLLEHLAVVWSVRDGGPDGVWSGVSG